MNEIVPLDQLATEIRYYSQQATWSIIEVGKRLIEAKKQLADEAWSDWLKKNVNFSRSTAHRFIQCAERFPNVATLQQLNPSQMIALLSLPEQETEEFIEAKKAEGNPIEDMTVKTLRQEIKDWKNKAEQSEEKAERAEQANKALTEQFNAQAEELQDLKNNPQVVIKDSEQTTNKIWNLQGENKQLRDKIDSLESRIHESSFKDSQIRALQQNNQELERKLEEYTAHSRGQTFHEYATENAEREEHFKHLLKTHDEEAKAAKELKEFFYKTRELPDSPIEMRESLRCYLAIETDKRRGIEDLLQAIEITEKRMEVLREAIENKNGRPKLEVVKK